MNPTVARRPRLMSGWKRPCSRCLLNRASGPSRFMAPRDDRRIGGDSSLGIPGPLPLARFGADSLRPTFRLGHAWSAAGTLLQFGVSIDHGSLRFVLEIVLLDVVPDLSLSDG